MEALWASYGSDSEDSVDFSLGYDNINSSPTSSTMSNPNMDPILLPPPPVELLQPPNSTDLSIFQGDRVRSFPHVAGNYSLHIFIPACLFFNQLCVCHAVKSISFFLEITKFMDKRLLVGCLSDKVLSCANFLPRLSY
ncbi:hypothetical protein HPP92_025268 [Vanilla planifolia]|uniref:U6 snRNA phosphodiesterase 1 n=1 Tax=Vanilla planifolia TaxID=51239 RepID=A0A835PIR5_VANPL|nr:hypothetical protein HPP92_025268 [Vanilla planifolia]